LLDQVICLDINDEGNKETVRQVEEARPGVAVNLVHCDIANKDEVNSKIISLKGHEKMCQISIWGDALGLQYEQVKGFR
jgi:hypothetical protein